MTDPLIATPSVAVGPLSPAASIGRNGTTAIKVVAIKKIARNRAVAISLCIGYAWPCGCAAAGNLVIYFRSADATADRYALIGADRRRRFVGGQKRSQPPRYHYDNDHTAAKPSQQPLIARLAKKVQSPQPKSASLR